MDNQPFRPTKKQLFFICITFPILSIAGWCWRSQVPYQYIFSSFDGNDTNLQRDTSKEITILMWHWPFGVPEPLEEKRCIPHCRVVVNRNLFSKADMVIFHNRELVNGAIKLPVHLPRPKEQRWVWMSMESPPNNGNMKPFGNIFNLTMSYRRDADIVAPYGMILPKKPGDEEEPFPFSNANKTSIACWVVSNYQQQHRRSQVFEELSAVIPVTVFGRWKKRPLNSDELLPTISHCYFYLAFENSISKDYITEKLWFNSFRSGAVPVVLGPSVEDYKAVVPPNSFIHVDEFASPSDLGKHLLELVNDTKSYAEYHKWRRDWKLENFRGFVARVCKICSIYDSLPQQKVYGDLSGWVWGKDH